MSNLTEFSIVYGGDAYSDNQIDARTLGNALTSFVTLLEHSNKVLEEQLDMPISDSRKNELIELREIILSKNIDAHKMYLDACQTDLKKSLEE